MGHVVRNGYGQLLLSRVMPFDFLPKHLFDFLDAAADILVCGLPFRSSALEDEPQSSQRAALSVSKMPAFVT